MIEGILSPPLTCYKNNSDDIHNFVQRSVKLYSQIKRLTAAEYGCWSILKQLKTVRVMFHCVFQRIQMSRNYRESHDKLMCVCTRCSCNQIISLKCLMKREVCLLFINTYHTCSEGTMFFVFVIGGLSDYYAKQKLGRNIDCFTILEVKTKNLLI